jgi:hypothetical protein
MMESGTGGFMDDEEVDEFDEDELED